MFEARAIWEIRRADQDAATTAPPSFPAYTCASFCHGTEIVFALALPTSASLPGIVLHETLIRESAGPAQAFASKRGTEVPQPDHLLEQVN